MFQRESKNSRQRGASINRRRKATDAGHQIDVIVDISIHAPVGGATNGNRFRVDFLAISIHAPRGGSDPIWMAEEHRQPNFNPHSPWGERRPNGHYMRGGKNFNPRSPWGE